MNLLENLPMRTAEELLAEKLLDTSETTGIDIEDLATVLLSGTDEQREELGFNNWDALAMKALRGDEHSFHELLDTSISEYVGGTE